MNIKNNGKDQVVEEGINVMPEKIKPSVIDQRKLVFGHLSPDMGGGFAISDEVGAATSDGSALFNPGEVEPNKSKITTE